MSLRHLASVLFLSTFSLAGCMGEIVEADIGPSRTLCAGEGVYGCLNIRSDSTAEWSLGYGDVRGFTFEWGYITRVRMSRRSPEPGTMDDPGGFELIAVLSKTPVPAGTREVLVAREMYGENPWTKMVTGSCASGYRLYGEAPLRFADTDACLSFESSIKTTEHPSAIEIEYGAPGAPLTVVSVRDYKHFAGFTPPPSHRPAAK